MDGHHEGCVFHFRDWYQVEKIHECSCECHSKKPKPPPPPERPFAGPDPKKSGKRRNKNMIDENTPPPTIKRPRRKKSGG